MYPRSISSNARSHVAAFCCVISTPSCSSDRPPALPASSWQSRQLSATSVRRSLACETRSDSVSSRTHRKTRLTASRRRLLTAKHRRLRLAVKRRDEPQQDVRRTSSPSRRPSTDWKSVVQNARKKTTNHEVVVRRQTAFIPVLPQFPCCGRTGQPRHRIAAPLSGTDSTAGLAALSGLA